MKITSIKNKIIVNSAAFLFVVTGIIFLNIYYFQKLNVNNSTLFEITNKLKIYNSLSQKLALLNVNYQSFDLNKDLYKVDSRLLEKQKIFFEWYNTLEKELKSSLITKNQKEVFQNVSVSLLNVKELGSNLRKNIKTGASDNSIKENINKIKEQLQGAIKYLEILIMENSTQFENIGTDNSKINSQVTYVLEASLVIMYIAFFLITVPLVRTINKELEGVLTKLNDNVKSLLKSSTDVFTASDTLSTHGLQFTSGLQETISSISEVSAMVQKNTETTVESTQLSNKSKNASVKGRENIDEMIDIFDKIISGNNEVMTEIESNNKDLVHVVEIIREIEEKTKVINEIVFHTKLLSFNASVEAARAGDKGKGFAVVAEEVGNLATMSGNAAKEITNLLTTSTEQVSQIVYGSKNKIDKKSAEFSDRINEGQSKANECLDSFKLIESNIDSVDTYIHQIATASKEQNIGIKEITHAIQVLDKVNHDNNKISDNTKKLSGSLKSEANKLNEVIEDLVLLSGLSLKKIQHSNNDFIKNSEISNVSVDDHDFESFISPKKDNSAA